MDRLRQLQLFVRTVELGSLSAAARELRLSQPTVSKAIGALEQALGVRLIERSTTRLSVTAAGAAFHERARRLVEDWDEAASSVQGEARAARGLLRLNAPLGFGEMHLERLVRGFLARHPEIEVELILDDRYADLVAEGADVALRLGGPLPPTAVARELATAQRHVVAAPAYLARHAPIAAPADLRGHEFVRYAWLASGLSMTLLGPGGEHEVALQGRYGVNSALCVRNAVCAGLGLAIAPSWLVADLVAGGQLVRVLPDWATAPQVLRAVLPSRRFLPARTQLFLAWMAQAVREVPGLAPPAAPGPGPGR